MRALNFIRKLLGFKQIDVKPIETCINVPYINQEFNELYHQVHYIEDVTRQIDITNEVELLLTRLKRLKPGRFNSIITNEGEMIMHPTFTSRFTKEVLSPRVSFDLFNNLLLPFEGVFRTHSLIMSILLNVRHSDLVKLLHWVDDFGDHIICKLDWSYTLDKRGVILLLEIVEDIFMYKTDVESLEILYRCREIRRRINA
jgi:hypothetical protein